MVQSNFRKGFVLSVFCYHDGDNNLTLEQKFRPWKKLMPGVGFGKSDKLDVQLTKDLVLPENLEEIKQVLSAHGEIFFTGIVTIKNDSFPVILVPYEQEHKQKLKLYCHVIFDTSNTPKITQDLTNRISKKACRQILAMMKMSKI